MAYENLSREELISALETLTGVDQFAAGAATDPNVGGASVVPPPLRSGGAPAYYRDQPEATPFYDQQFPYFGFDQTKQMGGTMPIPNYTGMPEGVPTTMPIPGATALPEGVPSTMPLDASVVRPIGETIDSVMRQPEQGRAPIGDPGFEPASEQDLMFHRVQRAVRRGEEPEAPQWMIDMVRAVPEEDWASAFAGGDEALRAFHQKHGFPPAAGG